MPFTVAKTTLSAAVAQNGTFTVSYPAGTNSGTYVKAKGHKLWSKGLQTLFDLNTGFTLSFGSSNITVTYKGVTPIPANTDVSLQLDIIGPNSRKIEQKSNLVRASVMTPVSINLGAPIAGAANNQITSQALTLASGGTTTFTGTLAGVNDVPRNIVAAWTNTAVLTVTGVDEYGNVMVESSGSGTSFTGKKAFAKITKVAVSADVTGLTVGTGNVFGLPIALLEAALVLGEAQDGAKPTAGTIVGADTAAASATTGDVRGTYTPNATPDASKAFQLFAYVEDPTDLGVPQFAG